MAVDLRILSNKLPIPSPPRKKIWGLVSVLIIILPVVFMLILIPEYVRDVNIWFWPIVILVPLSLAGIIIGIRVLIYEQKREYVLAWNLQCDESINELTKIGQKSIHCLEWIYAVDNLSCGLSQLSSNNLQLIHSKSYIKNETCRFTKIEFLPDDLDKKIIESIIFLLNKLDINLSKYLFQDFCQTVVSINCKDIEKYKIKELVNIALPSIFLSKKIEFRLNDSKLNFLDSLLDNTNSELIAYIDLNLNIVPKPNSAEFISLMMLSNKKDPSAIYLDNKKVKIHRPVYWEPSKESLEYAITTAINWGDLEPKDIQSIWFANLIKTHNEELLSIIEQLNFSLTVNDIYDIEQVIGKVNNNITNVLIPAMEYAQHTQRPQLVMIQNNDLYILVVKPIDYKVNK